MVTVEEITSLEGPDLAPYRTMRWQHEHRRDRIFVAEGEKVVRRLLESEFTVLSLLLPRKWYEEYKPLLERRSGQTIRVFLAEKPLLEQLTGFSMYQGVLAVGQIPAPSSLDEILGRCQRPYLFVAVDGVSSGDNLGLLVRNCAAFGISALLVSGSGCSPYLRRAVRGSMGTIFRLPILEGVELPELIRHLKSRGVACLAAHPHTTDTPLWQAALRDDCCIVLGSEGYGLSPEVLELCDRAVVIPMASGVDSLNVATAGAVFLYEASRQRSELTVGNDLASKHV